ncbi:MAG: M48 family metalloprotease [Planctomycetia bacterium]|nr:M48 family metalloprotease [Planctomycetia bacterium]
MNSLTISAATVDRLGWVLLHSFWQFVLIAMVAAVLQRQLRQSKAATRYLVLLAGFSAIVLVPAVTWLIIPRPDAPTFPTVPAIRDVSAAMRPARPATARESVARSPAPADEFSAPVSLPREDRASISIGWPTVETFVRPWLNTLVAIWCCGVFAFAWRPVLGWYTVRRLRRVGVFSVPAGIEDLLHRTAERLAVSRPVQVLQSALVRVPLVVGCLRPAILLPVSIVSGLSAEQLLAILAHELAHIRRHDYLVNLAQTLVETVFFYHPAVWWLSRQIRNERENCCDDLAVAVVGNSLDYGQALLAVEELRATPLALAVGATGGSLVARIRRLLKTEPAPGRKSFPWSMGSAVASLALAISLAIGVSTVVRDQLTRESVASEDKKSEKKATPTALKAKAAAPEADAATPSRDIIIAEHVLLRDGKIVTWEQVVNDWTSLGQPGKPNQLGLHLTSGAIKAGLWERYQAAIRKLERETGAANHVGFRWMSHRAALRYDAIRTAADLAPKPEQIRTGIVLNSARRAVSGVTVVLLPEDSPHVPIMLRDNLSLRDPLDEIWTRTDAEGRFRIAAPDSGYRLAAVSPDGFGLAPIPKAGEQAEMTLQPLAEVELTNAGKSPQSLTFQLDLPSLPDSCWGFAIHGFSLGNRPTTVRLPPGRLTVSRELDLFRGAKNIVPAHVFLLQPGEKKPLSLAAADADSNSKLVGLPRFPSNVNPALISDRALRSLQNPTNVEWSELALEDCLTYLHEYHQISIHFDKYWFRAAKIPLDTPVTLKVENVELHSVLKSILDPLHLGYFVDPYGLVVTTQENAAADPRPDSPDSRQKVDAIRALDKPTDVDFRERRPSVALQLLGDYHNISIRVDRDSLGAAKRSLDNPPVTLQLKGVSLRSVLKLILEPLQLGYLVDAQGLVVTTQEKAAEQTKPDPMDDDKHGSSFLRQIRRDSEPLLAGLAKDHGYGLTKGQDVRRVAPPFAPLRMTYYRIGHPSQSQGIPRGPSAMLFRWQDERLLNWGMTFGGGAEDGYSLDGVLNGLLEIKSHRIEGPRELRNKTLPGDWILRAGAAEEQLVKQLESILRTEFSLPVRLGFRNVERQVYVASGDYKHQPSPGRPEKATLILTDETITTDPVDIYGKQLVPGSGAGGGTGEFPEFLEWLGRWIETPIVSEVKTLPASQLSWSLHERSPSSEQTRREDHDAKLVLANITAQTGITFQEAKRPIKILFVERD